MINLPTESSAVQRSKESPLFLKRSRGKVRLPPIATRQLTRHIPQQKTTMQTGRQGRPQASHDSNLSSPFITDNLLTPTGDYKCPRSPSNLSLRFNFEDPKHAEKPESLKNYADRASRTVSSKSGHKRMKDSVSKTPRSGKSGIRTKPKGYHVLNNEEPVAYLEKHTTEIKNRRSSTISGTSTVSPQATSRNDNTVTPRSPGSKLSVETALRAGKASDKERKRSTYDLREFLSLPPDTEHKLNAMSLSTRASSKATLRQHGDKKPVKLAAKPKSSDNTYDVFEFLALPAESSKQYLTGAEQNRLKELRPQKAAKVKSTESTEKPEIPSVIVADWSLNDDSPRPRTKQTVRPSRELPKANFPSDDFPQRGERHRTLEPPKKSRQRNSIYDLKEFLMLPDAARRRSIQKVSPQTQEAKPRSNSVERDSTREPDVKYDLGEFLNFLESGGSGVQAAVAVNAPGREQAMGELRNRSLSIYDIYGFLKATNPKELAAGIAEGTNETSVIDVTKLVAKSSPNSSLRDMHPVSNEGKASHGSSYDLREFLTLPTTLENNQNDSKTKRSAAERLKMN